MTGKFSLRVVGSPSIVGPQGQRVDLPLGKPMAALCYVALERSRVRRGDLGSVLWSRSAPERRRASVRQALWLLRKTVGEDLLTESGGELRLDPTRVEVDLDEFEGHLAATDLVEAWRMWEGGPLHDFAIPDAPRWNDWADRVRGRWERRFGEALEVRAAAEDGGARVTWLRRALEVRPFRESAHVALVDAYIHQRSPDEAESALHKARTVVDEPTPSLFSDLEERLRSLRKRSFDDGEERLRFEFVGRAPKFAALTSLWRSVLSGRPRAGVVVGPEGIGKSRLVEEFLELAAADGARVASVKGTDAERAIELGSLALLTKELLAVPGAAGISSGSLSALRGLVPSAVRDSDPPGGTPGRAAVGDALLDLMEAVAHEGPLILRVEDLHWIDPTSRDLLFRTIRHLRNASVFLIATCRSEHADASVLRRLRRLQEEKASEEIHLAPLSRAEVGELLGLTLDFSDDSVADDAASRLYRASGGNPLFLVELLLGLREEGVIREAAGAGRGWEMVGLPEPESLALPRTLREALRRRLADLGDSARTVGRVLAGVEGGLLPGELVRRAGLGEGEGTEALGDLLRRDVVRWDRQDRLHVAHDAMREFLLREGDGGKGGDPRRLGVGLGALVLAAAVVGILCARSGPGAGTVGEGGPFGGGVLFVDQRGQMMGYRFHAGPAGGVHLEKADSFAAEAGVHFGGAPFPGGAGEWWVPAAGTRVLGEDPDAWLVTRDSIRMVYATEGDDNLLQIAPDGRHYLLSVQDPDTTWFGMNLVRYDPVTGDTAVVVAGSGDASWSTDGSLILAHPRSGGVDSVLVVRPDGTRVAATSVPGGFGSARAWCGDGGTVVGSSLPRARRPEVWMWRFTEPTPEPLELPVPFIQGLTCSPRGRELAYFGRSDRGTVLVVYDLISGEVHTLDGVGPTGRIHWVDDAPPGAPRAVDVAPDAVELVRGEWAALEYEVVGVREPLPVSRRTWRSSDPLVAAVTADGRVVGNGPGEAWVALRVDGWLEDSVHVSVTEREDTGGPSFADRLDALDRDIWYTIGYPAPVPDTLDGGQVVLSMEGDGSYRDGVVTRRRFHMGRGATLEVDFRLPLTRLDRQQIMLCLMDGEPGSDPVAWDLWRFEESLCFRWPAQELERFDAGDAGFSATSSPMGPVRVDSLVRLDEWNRASIQVRPDGTASLFLNGSHVATLWDRIPMGPGEHWRLALFGQAADTRLHVRNLVLWGEARAELPPG